MNALLRRTVAALAFGAILSLGAFGGTASAANAVNGQAPYATATNAFGLVQCANWSVEVGEAYGPGFLYVNALSWRTKGVYCQGGAYPGQPRQVASAQYRLMAWSDYGQVWYPCWDWDVPVYNGAPIGPSSYIAGGAKRRVVRVMERTGPAHLAQDFDVGPGCGATYYSVQSFHRVAMDPGSGTFLWYEALRNTPAVYPVWLNG